jgi:Xaa-Pro aminopeptidase
MTDHHARRRESLARALAEEGVDAFLITRAVNVTYLTGFTGDSSVLLTAAGRAVLISDPRYVGQIADECPGLETHIRQTAQKLPDAVGSVLTRLGCRDVACESNGLTLADAEAYRDAAAGIAWKPKADRVESLRMVKDEAELAEVRDAIAIAERAFAAFRALLRPDDNEKDLADSLEQLVRRCGAVCTSFPPIVAVGERAALPHCPPTSKRVHESDLLLVDWGATNSRLYKSDLTRVLRTRRTTPSSGGPSLEEIHGIVDAAREAAIRAVRPGAVAKDVDAAARSVIADAGLGERFGHGLGHGIGLEIHEAPAIRPNSETVLEPGMVFTIEPGVYLPGWGGVRIEDDVLVTGGGCEVLTSVSRRLEG